MIRMSDSVKSHGEAIDAFLGELARQSRSTETRRAYQWTLGFLATDAEKIHKSYVSELTLDDYERTLNRWVDLAPSSLCQRISCFRTYSRFLWRRGWADTWVCAELERPRRPRYEELDVVTVSGEDVLKMLAAARNDQEWLCLTTAIYLGARRGALSKVRRGDINLVHGTVRFLEKGGKVIVKPLPDEYMELLRAYDDNGFWQSPDDYLIPSRRPSVVRRKERSDKVIWETIKSVGARAGVRCHVHALRAAFAVAFDEAHPGELYALKDLMGHSRVETTLVYLRRKDRARAMESVRDLSWGGFAAGSGLPEDGGVPQTGFEPVLAEDALAGPLRMKLDALRARSVTKERA